MVNKEEIKVGTHIIIRNDKGELLLCKRNKKFGFGEWELPGGHVEFQESFENNLVRECEEELGIEVNVGKLVSVAPNTGHGNHYIIFTFVSDSFTGTPECREPDEHSQIRWFDIESLPENLFISTKYALEDYLSGEIYATRSNSLKYYVYILRTSGDTLYIGQTSNLEKRIEEHKSKSGRSAKYVRYFDSVELVYNETYSTRSEAMKRESQLKRLTRGQKLKLINRS